MSTETPTPDIAKPPRLKVILPRTICTDKASGRKGMITMVHFTGGNVTYSFQPEGMTAVTQKPHKSEWIDASRIGDAEPADVPAHVPLEAIGTEVFEANSGIRGTLVGLILWTTGCVHGFIQQPGAIKSGENEGNCFEYVEFDIRRLEGPSLKKWTEEELKKDIKTKPSPGPFDRSGMFPNVKG